MRRLKVAAAILTVAALGLAGCAPGPADNTTGTADATVVVGSRTPPVNLDNTGGAGQGITEALYRNVYEPLLALEEDGSIKPTLAESDEVSDDGLTYTFKLRAGVKFHSGKDLKASDVKFSFERVLAESSKAARKADLGVISKVDATDDRTVTVTLKQRAQSFRYLVTYVWILPENITNVATTTDGTGPYKVSDYQAGTQLTLQRTDGYWGEQAKNKEVTFRYFSSSTAQTNALTSGQIDLITNVDSPEQVKAFEGKSDYKVSEGKSTVKQVLAFNDRKAPFNNTAVRKAIRKAVNREAIRKATWDTYGQLIGSFVPPQDPWYKDLTAIDAYDPTKAKAELTAAGYPNGFTFTLVTPNTEVHQISAQAVKSDLAKVGITVNIELIDPSSWYEKVFQNKDFDVTLQEHVNDRDLVWYGNPDFYWGYNNPDVTQWVKDAQAAETPEQQTEIYKKIARKISEDAASDWLYLYPQLRVAASNLSGYPTDGKNSAFFVANIVKS